MRKRTLLVNQLESVFKEDKEMEQKLKKKNLELKKIKEALNLKENIAPPIKPKQQLKIPPKISKQPNLLKPSSNQLKVLAPSKQPNIQKQKKLPIPKASATKISPNKFQRKQIKPIRPPVIINLPTPDDSEHLYRVPWMEYVLKENDFYITQHKELLDELSQNVTKTKEVITNMNEIAHIIEMGETKVERMRESSAALNTLFQTKRLKKELMELQDEHELLESKRIRIISQMLDMQVVYLRKIEMQNSQEVPSKAPSPQRQLSPRDQQILQKEREGALKATEKTVNLAKSKKRQESKLKQAQALLKQLQNAKLYTDPSEIQNLVENIAKLRLEMQDDEAHYKAIDNNLRVALEKVNQHLANMNELTQQLVKEQKRQMFNKSKIPMRSFNGNVNFNKTIVADESSVVERVLNLENQREIVLSKLMESQERINNYESQLNNPDNSLDESFNFIGEEINVEMEQIEKFTDLLKKIEKELMRCCEVVIFNSSNYSYRLNQRMRIIYKGLSKRGYKPSKLPIRRPSKVISSPRKITHGICLKNLIFNILLIFLNLASSQKLTKRDYNRRMKKASERLRKAYSQHVL